ncbi:MAG: hypothetical protein C5B54_00595 [Acidobacteria bacterium]|nr:MAG: hypothetical protein C5B54_00595 [Acidobacteriota bacterium]
MPEQTEILSWEQCMEILDAIPAMPVEQRRESVAKLIRNPSPGIRQRAIQVGAQLLPDEQLVTYLRNSSDDVVRNSGLEILKEKGKDAVPLALKLLGDEDPDVVLQAVLVLDHSHDQHVLEPLRKALQHNNPNVVQAVITAIGHLEDPAALSDILPFLKGGSLLGVAAIEAAGHLRNPDAVAPLKKILRDSVLAPLAAESLARIGGPVAFRALAQHWMGERRKLELDTILDLMTQVAKNLKRPPREVPELRTQLAILLHSDSVQLRKAAATCLLSLGPGEQDEDALNVLATEADSFVVPIVLEHRKDLVPMLLKQKSPLGTWGILIAAKDRKISASSVADCLNQLELPEIPGSFIDALARIRSAEFAPAFMNLYLRSLWPSRQVMAELMRSRKKQMRSLIPESADAETKIVLSALVGESSKTVARLIEELPVDRQQQMIPRIMDRAAIVRSLPWKKWLHKDPASYAPIATEVAVKANLKQLIPVFRKILSERPIPEMIRALGELQDIHSVSLITKYRGDSALTDALIVESLGRIGGTEARKVLREMAGPDSKDRRLAYRALSQCATEEDLPFFHESISDRDWFIRLSAVDVLARYPGSENYKLLRTLASDPFPMVAQRARAAAEALRSRQ